MAGHAGPAPWDQQAYAEFRQGYKRLNARTRKNAGVEHSTTSGYRVADQGVNQTGRRPAMRRLTLNNGQTVEVPVDDYDNFIGFNKMANDEAGAAAVSAYIENAFNGNRPFVKTEGVGHIVQIAYSATYQSMRVEFEKGSAVVVFFRVPKEVYAELQYLAQSGGTQLDAKGVERHSLGIRFWDIVRIRGNLHGTRYAFTYIQNEYQRSERSVMNDIRNEAVEELGNIYQAQKESGEFKAAQSYVERIEQDEKKAAEGIPEDAIMKRATSLRVRRPGMTLQTARTLATEQLIRERDAK